MRRLAPLLFCLLALLTPLRALAHGADEDYTLTTSCDLLDDRIEQKVYIPAWFLVNELYGEQTTLKSLSDKTEDCKANLAGWMVYNNPILVNGVAIKPQVRSMEARSTAFLDNQPFPAFAADMGDVEDAFLKHNTGVVLVLDYPLAQKPQTISVRWRQFMLRVLPDGSLSKPPVSLFFYYDGKHRATDLTPQEPEWIWHASAVAPPPESAKLSQKWEPVQWRIPAGALALAIGGVAAMLLLWRKNRAVALLVLMVDLGLGAYAWQAGIGAVTTNSPFQKQLVRPNQPQAEAIFRDLLGGVYKAFDFNQDSDIYDALSHCVDGPALEQMYRDVHGALVLDDTEGGGAVCQVDEVKVGRCDLLPATAGDEPDTLRLRCAWTVRGTVSHWQHTHTRANAYEAQYTLAVRAGSDGPRWKITGCQVTAQQPVDVEGKQP